MADAVAEAVAQLKPTKQQAPKPPVVSRGGSFEVGTGEWDKRVQKWGHWLQHSAGGEKALAMKGDLKIDQTAVSEANDDETSLWTIARACAEKTLGRSPRGRAEVWRHSFASTGDFPLLLEDTMNKRLAAMYEQAAPTWSAICRTESNPDFRPRDVDFEDSTPTFEEVIEGGEIRYDSGVEAQESFKVRTYAKGFRVTRNLVINDDLGFLARRPNQFARAGINLENGLVWEQITGNNNVQGSALFSTARDTLIDSSVTGFTGTDDRKLTGPTLGKIMARLATRKDRKGNTVLNMSYMTLVVPEALRYDASKLLELSNYQPNTVDGVIPGYVRNLRLVAEPLLDATSTTDWYLFASPTAVDIGVLAYLRGSTGPMIMTENTTSVLGVDYKAVHDVGAKVLDYYGVLKVAA